MKSNFFKIALPAFALMLAITASLAFTSDDDPCIFNTGDPAYYSGGGRVPQPTVDDAAPINCTTVDQNNGPCTLIVPILGARQISHESDFSVLCWLPEGE